MDFATIELFARAALWLEKVVGLQLTPIQRPGLARQWYFECQGYGKNLAHRLWLDGGWLNFECQGYDQIDAPTKPLLRIAAGAEGFRVVCKLISALERSGTVEIKLPMQVGQVGMRDCWVLGS